MAKNEELLLITNIPREKGYLYYTKTDEKGNITLLRALSGKRWIKDDRWVIHDENPQNIPDYDNKK